MSPPSNSRRPRIVAALTETFGFSPLLASLVALFFLVLAAAAILWLFLSAPPRTFTITSGPPGSSLQRRAEDYRVALAKRGVTLTILPSSGSIDNLHRLEDPASGVDVGFVQGGHVGENPPPGLVSLGSVAYQPLWIFYRGTTRISRLSELAGQRLGIGAPGSGVQALARALLDLNGIAGAPTVLVEKPSEAAGQDFLAGKLDAVFLMGDSAPSQTLRTLLRTPDVQVFDFLQADAYVRKLSYLNKVVLPQGGIDFGLNLPAQDITLVAPTVELIVRDDFNSALSDLLLSIAQKVHGKGSLLARPGEFPAPLKHEFELSDDALRYYKSGQGFTYKLVSSFWLASLINRALVAIVPMLLVAIPAIRFLPVLYRWSVQMRIYRCYRPLLRLEREAGTTLTAANVAELLHRLDEIERVVNGVNVPASFASQFYDLRNHVAFVRRRLTSATAG